MISQRHKIPEITINTLWKTLLIFSFTTIFIIGGSIITKSYGETTQEWKDECNRIAYDSDEDTPPHVLTVDVEIIDIGEINRDAGTFEADFWLRLSMDETKNDGHSFHTLGTLEPDFNGRLHDGNGQTIGSLKEPNSLESSDISYYEQRKQGMFYSNMNFHNFPFETIELILEIEMPSPCSVRSLTFVKEGSIFDVRKAVISGWNVIDSNFDINSQNYQGYGYDEEYTKFVGKIYVQGEPSSALIGIFFPIGIITFLGISPTIFRHCKIMPPVLIPESIGLFSLVTLHVSILEKIPPVGYATLFDYVMMAVYVVIIGVPIIDRWQNQKRKDRSEKLLQV